MPLAEVPAILILLGLAAYVLLAGADFGAPLWSLTGFDERGRRIRSHTHSAIAPVWEANHVWLIFVLVVCWTAYPEVFGSLFSTLYIPLLLAGIGIIVRAMGYLLGGIEDRPWVAMLFAFASILAPFSLGTVIGAIASGRVPIGNAQGDLFSSWLNLTSITIGCLAVAFSAYLAAVYLAGDGARKGSNELSEAFRARGLAAGVVAGGLAIAGLAALHSDAAHIYDGLTSGSGLLAVIASALAGLATMAALYLRRYEAARYGAAAAVGAIVVGWGIAQYPDILPGLTIAEAAADDNVIIALLASIAVGLMLLIPSMLLLYGLVLRGRFDEGAPAAAGDGPSVPLGAVSGRRAPIACVAAGVIGAGMTFFSDGGVTLAVGVVLLLGFVGSAFVLLSSHLSEVADGE